MNSRAQTSSFYVGWDVGGWNCDKNTKSRDALVILDADRKLVGQPWRGNLRSDINDATDTADWISRLFALCQADAPTEARITLAIDAPLGFSEAFVSLVTGVGHVVEVRHAEGNPYLFRRTERYLFDQGLKPLSAVKDMIGSQATKGMHAIDKFAPQVLRCGVWGDGAQLTAIEVYPSSCNKASAFIKRMQQPFGELGHADFEDALTCALLAYLFDTQPDTLVPPEVNKNVHVPASEGWIWLPKDALGDSTLRKTGK